jgi:UDP-hydrolysing UDP-N-acetyl-D-glucosamine 2-epimerase
MTRDSFNLTSFVVEFRLGAVARVTERVENLMIGASNMKSEATLNTNEFRRKIAVVTTSRADYGHLYWPLKDLSSHPQVDLKLIVLGAHLSPEFGRTIQEIEKDGFKIEARVECLLSSDTDVGMAKTIGVASLSLADLLGQIRPDLLLLIADRYEMLAPASVALALRIPIAHIEGGEVSEGAVDDAVRNALTKMSHIHFTSTQDARRRVIAMGEEPWRVHRAGAPSLDHLRRQTLFPLEQLETRLGVQLQKPATLVTYHPVTIALDTTREADALFAALDAMPDQILFCYPNADAGSRHLIERTRSFLASRSNSHAFINLDILTYWSLLRQVDVVLGNSSSGIMETPSFAVPTVNIGWRQQGRERARNILDAAPDVTSILEAVRVAKTKQFRDSLEGMSNPYGDGVASEKIVSVLTSVPLTQDLLMKRNVHSPVQNLGVIDSSPTTDQPHIPQLIGAQL